VLCVFYRSGTLPVGLQGRSALPVEDRHGSGTLPPRSAQGLPPDRAGRPACRECGMASRYARLRIEQEK
ncbi:hypothetical protein, partial [Victivallis vadensis]|uniref:hypothetical protein n=1 Tax=Victivallis vadensis TaxID=172901 RepID=UPI003AF511FA